MVSVSRFLFYAGLENLLPSGTIILTLGGAGFPPPSFAPLRSPTRRLSSPIPAVRAVASTMQ